MNRNSIRWRLPASYAVIALLAAFSLGSFMLLALRSYYVDQESRYLLGNAIALQPVLEQALQSHAPRDVVQDQIIGLAFLSQTQIRLLDLEGNALADSGIPGKKQYVAVAGVAERDIPFFSSSSSGPATLPEARAPIVIYSSEKSQILPEMIPFEKEIPYSGPAPQTDMILSVNASPYGYGFVAQSDFDLGRRSSQVVNVPLVAPNGLRLGTLELSNGPSYGSDVIDSVTGAWLIASVFAIAVAALAGWFMSKRVTGPVLALEQATRKMEQGDLRARVDLPRERQQEFLSLANSFNGMAAQVEQTVATLREFVADAAHELHTPLTALQANLELARNETLALGAHSLAPDATTGVPLMQEPGSAAESTSARARYLARAHEQSQRLEVLVQSLLDLSRIEAAESKANFAPVDYSRLVQEVGEQFASRAEQADRAFSLNILERGMQVMGNETQLRQVVINLLENAFKFTPQNGSITVDLQRSGNEARLTVGDTGIGIPSDDLTRLFERFHRARNAAEYAGNGLGLAIVKAILTRHGGNVTVQSQRGAGTQVNVLLPLASAGN